MNFRISIMSGSDDLCIMALFVIIATNPSSKTPLGFGISSHGMLERRKCRPSNVDYAVYPESRVYGRDDGCAGSLVGISHAGDSEALTYSLLPAMLMLNPDSSTYTKHASISWSPVTSGHLSSLLSLWHCFVVGNTIYSLVCGTGAS